MANGLYNAEYEHDACGVGMVVNIHGNKSHDLVDNALKVLENMRHRGAEGADGRTGDGAGICCKSLIQTNFSKKNWLSWNRSRKNLRQFVWHTGIATKRRLAN